MNYKSASKMSNENQLNIKQKFRPNPTAIWVKSVIHTDYTW